MDKYKKPLLAVLVFCLIQFLVGGLVAAAMMPLGMDMTSPTVLSLVLILTSIVTILAVGKGMKMVRVDGLFSTHAITPMLAVTATVGALAGILATDLVAEQLDLPNLMEDTMLGMASTVWGVLAIAVVGPITEEIVFREALLGHLLRRGANVYAATVFSALCFGIIHFNPAQVPFAFIVGLLLAIIYVRTGSILLTSIIHIINNSVACLEMNLLGERAKTFSYAEWMGGSGTAYTVAVVAAIISVWMMIKVAKSKGDSATDQSGNRA